jgi:hypothetical protein
VADHKTPLALAQAALMEIISKGQAIQAATLRGAGRDEVEKIRAEAHDMLDAYLDRSSEAAAAVKALLD